MEHGVAASRPGSPPLSKSCHSRPDTEANKDDGKSSWATYVRLRLGISTAPCQPAVGRNTLVGDTAGDDVPGQDPDQWRNDWDPARVG